MISAYRLGWVFFKIGLVAMLLTGVGALIWAIHKTPWPGCLLVSGITVAFVLVFGGIGLVEASGRSGEL